MRALPKNKVDEIRHQYMTTDITMVQLGLKYGVTAKSISRYLRGFDCENKKRGTGSVENYCNFTKLSRMSVKRIIILRLKYGLTQKRIAELFDIHQSTISKIFNGHSWKHLFQGAKKKYNQEILTFKSL
jgi:DNA-binding XRE family transcriptional regulator